MITLKHVGKKYEVDEPLKDVNCVIKKGDIISVIGPSGVGKSTLLRCINMIDPPTSGQIFLDDVEITSPDCELSLIRQKLGMVFQSFNLFFHMTVIENVVIPQIELKHKSKEEAYKLAMEYLRKVGLADKCFSYPDELSGGQKQRVAIARTLAMEPEIILFDEPTSALDPTMVGEVEKVIRDLKEDNITMMIVTHDMNFAKEISNRVFYMDMGGIYEDGTPEVIFDNPTKDRTRRFMKRLRVLELLIESKEADIIGMISSIEEYGFNNKIPYKMLYRIQSVFEEYCLQILMKEVDDIKIKVEIEYNSNDDTTMMIVLYNGPRFEFEDSDNEFSKTMIRNMSSYREFEEISIDNYTNKMVFKFEGDNLVHNPELEK